MVNKKTAPFKRAVFLFYPNISDLLKRSSENQFTFAIVSTLYYSVFRRSGYDNYNYECKTSWRIVPGAGFAGKGH